MPVNIALVDKEIKLEPQGKTICVAFEVQIYPGRNMIKQEKNQEMQENAKKCQKITQKS